MLPRRQFVSSALVAAGMCLNLRNVFAVQVGSSAELESDALSIALTALIAELPCSERLGRACVRSLASPEGLSTNLAQLVIADLDLGAKNHSPSNIKRAIRARIRRDFEERNIIDVDGWCLSLTETRLYEMTGL